MHDYTDEEIIQAANRAHESPRNGSYSFLRNYLDALPERPQAQPGPWPGQQEAIDAAFAACEVTPLSASPGLRVFEEQSSDRLAIAQAYDKARPQAAEIAKLKEELTHAERWRDKLDTKLAEIVEAAEKAGWDGVENSKNLPTFITNLAEDLSKTQAELAALRQSYEPADILGQLQQLACEKGNAEVIKEIRKYASSLSLEGVNSLLKGIQECLPPILADDGRSLGQVFAEKYEMTWSLIDPKDQKKIDDAAQAVAAQAVAAVVEARMIRRMEAVPVGELLISYRNSIEDDLHSFEDREEGEFTTDKVIQLALETVRARFITAVRGDEPRVVMNEPAPAAEPADKAAVAVVEAKAEITGTQPVNLDAGPSNVMLDLETLGTNPGCVILSIGAVLFGNGSLHEEFYIRISLKSAQEYGLTIDADTLQWWTRQPHEVFTEAMAGGNSLDAALFEFRKWIENLHLPPNWTIWSNGSSFDAPVLEAAFRKLRMQPPWTHVRERCFRTLRALDPSEPKVEPAIKHHALEDAKAQALHAMRIAPWL